MQITIARRLDSRSRAGFWKNDAAAVRAVRTTQQFILFTTYYNLLFITFAVIAHNSIVIRAQMRLRTLVEKDPLHGTGMTHGPQA
jgi:hypothetical protein